MTWTLTVEPTLPREVVGLEEALAVPGLALVPWGSREARGAHAALVRSRTRVDTAWLAAHPALRWVATASSGTEHLDPAALAAPPPPGRPPVAFTGARGGNAQAVADWVEVALERLADALPGRGRGGAPLGGVTVAVVGVGFVGRAVAARLRGLGASVLLNDPPRAAREPDFAPLHTPLREALAQADVLTLHVPLQADTRHLVGAPDLARFAGRVVLNAARGGVLDETAAVAWARTTGGRLGLDVFEGEPHGVAAEHVAAAAVATPHVAGHTAEGKAALINRSLTWLGAALDLPLGTHTPRSSAPSPTHPGRLVAPRADAPTARTALRDAEDALRRGIPFDQARPLGLRRALHAELPDGPLPSPLKTSRRAPAHDDR